MNVRPSPFAWVSFAMMVGVMSTALISPLYPLYQQAWSLQPSDISLIYVIYMGGALCSLLFVGRLPDRAGFRRVMQWGLVLTVLGTVMTALAWDMISLIVGRFIVGVASSMLTTSASLGLSQLARPGQAHRVAMMTGFLIALGFGLGPLVGGIMGQWAPLPLRTAYVPTVLLCSLALWVLHRLSLPAHTAPDPHKRLQWRDVLPKLTLPQRHEHVAFALTCALPFLAFGVFGLYASMSPLFLDKLVPWHGPVVSGTAIAVILLASACTQILAGSVPTHRCGSWGLWGLALSNAVLMLNLWLGSGWLFAIGVALTAASHGMSMLAGISMVNRIATAENRSGLLSTYLVIGYIGSMLPMMGIGWLADHFGMTVGVSSFCVLVVAMGSYVGWRFKQHPRMQPVPVSQH